MPCADCRVTITPTRSQPTYFQTPSLIATTRHGAARLIPKGTHTAPPEPTGGFFLCPAVSTCAGPPAVTATAALSPLDAPATKPPPTTRPMSVVSPASGSAATA